MWNVYIVGRGAGLCKQSYVTLRRCTQYRECGHSNVVLRVVVFHWLAFVYHNSSQILYFSHQSEFQMFFIQANYIKSEINATMHALFFSFFPHKIKSYTLTKTHNETVNINKYTYKQQKTHPSIAYVTDARYAVRGDHTLSSKYSLCY